jgi:putative tryptophan/tyrosine transport system substrate-binding protein
MAARGKRAAAMPVIGFLNSGFPAERASFVAAFRQGLKETGYVEGRTVAIRVSFCRGSLRIV